MTQQKAILHETTLKNDRATTARYHLQLSEARDKLRIVSKLRWCERGDSNPHGYPLDPKSSASASSATLARSEIERLSSRNFQTQKQSRKHLQLCQGPRSDLPR